jgi:hypothetical protein
MNRARKKAAPSRAERLRTEYLPIFDIPGVVPHRAAVDGEAALTYAAILQAAYSARVRRLAGC